MERINLHVRPEDLRYVSITCKCGVKSTAEIPEQVAKSFNAHICTSCGQMYRITLNEQGNVTGKDGRKWIVSRGPSVENIATMDEKNVREAMDHLHPDENACTACHGSGRSDGVKCGNCWGTGRKDAKFEDVPTDERFKN